jgi:energy-coupling factor transporter ATP-binding protein EcfA2
MNNTGEIPNPDEPASPPATPGEVSNEAKALAEIVLWSKECPPWQRDALHRLCQQEEPDHNDVVELVRLCKREPGIKPMPLSAEHVRDVKASSATVYLRSIHSAQYVNALATGQKLAFDKTGVTVVYGDNGSGKSGYTRILKKVCRARLPRDNKIIPNIYASKTGVPTAVVEFAANGQNRQVTWVDAKTANPLLSAVSVFDSHTANVHVDQTNDVAYTPYPMKLLEGLAQLCVQVKQKLAAEIQAIEQQTPATLKKPECQPQTKVGKLIAALGASTDPKSVRSLGALSAEEQARLETLKSDLASDPVKTARALQARKTRLDGHIAALERLHQSVTTEKTSSLTTLYTAYDAARQAASVAAGGLFAHEPLPHVGSETWRALWESARAYSRQEAYPDTDFPATGEGARCVLCQQELKEEAARRLLRFEDFIRDESKKREQESLEAYDAALRELRSAIVPSSSIPGLVGFIRDELDDDALASEVRRSLITARWSARHIRRTHTLAQPPAAPIVTVPPLAGLTRHRDELSKRITALQGESKSEEHKKMIAEHADLADRLWLSLVQDDVLAEIDRRKIIDALKNAQKDTSTTRITTKSAEIAEGLVTNALRAQFVKEVDRLGVAGLAIELRNEKTAYGMPLFRVSLIKKPDAKVGDILSEGEHRCVALAAFLAELSTTDSRSALVFDDPVSSLDHMHRDNLAKRFASEGQHRQVIIFTHDVAFLFLLHENCREVGTHIAFRSVTRGEDYAGFCHQNPPPTAQPVDKVIESMVKQLENQKVQYEQGDQQAWYLTVRSLQDQLRTTWERAVEEAVAPVIKRLANKVDTKGLSKLTAIGLEDCKVMRKAYGRCSQLLHSSSEALNKPLPAPKVIAAEIESLRDWVAQIRERQDKIEMI